MTNAKKKHFFNNMHALYACIGLIRQNRVLIRATSSSACTNLKQLHTVLRSKRKHRHIFSGKVSPLWVI